jgi:hypothetical protein
MRGHGLFDMLLISRTLTCWWSCLQCDTTRNLGKSCLVRLRVFVPDELVRLTAGFHSAVPVRPEHGLNCTNGATVFAMRHGKKMKKLGLPADQRKALLRGLVTETLRHGRITTTKVCPFTWMQRNLSSHYPILALAGCMLLLASACNL